MRTNTFVRDVDLEGVNARCVETQSRGRVDAVAQGTTRNRHHIGVNSAPGCLSTTRFLHDFSWTAPGSRIEGARGVEGTIGLREAVFPLRMLGCG